VHATLPLLEFSDFPAIKRKVLETLQVNLGYKCNQTCVHCHVNAGPTRTEEMDRETMHIVLRFLEASSVGMLDITGGAPELNQNFRELVQGARVLGVHVIDRCNLTILEEPGEESLAEFLAANRVEITASLPCYTEELVDRQRGKGAYELSIRALRRLNTLGYGMDGSGLDLNLVYNPQGPTLPPSQEKLQADYRSELGDRFGIRFNRLYTLTNMPIARFGSMLISKGQFNAYMRLLQESFREENLDAVMCRSLISVDWQGYVYDCDFNQMLELRVNHGLPPTIWEFDLHRLLERQIVFGSHCYGCTAGAGSSCGGAVVTQEKVTSTHA